jgi:hypothetical protein
MARRADRYNRPLWAVDPHFRGRRLTCSNVAPKATRAKLGSALPGRCTAQGLMRPCGFLRRPWMPGIAHDPNKHSPPVARETLPGAGDE